MSFIKSLFCSHEWKVLNQILSRPWDGNRPLNIKSDKNFANVLMHGQTKSTYYCVKCGKIIFKETCTPICASVWPKPTGHLCSSSFYNICWIKCFKYHTITLLINYWLEH